MDTTTPDGVDRGYATRLVRAVVDDRTLGDLTGGDGTARLSTFVVGSPAEASEARGRPGAKPMLAVAPGTYGAPALVAGPGAGDELAGRVRAANRRMAETHAAVGHLATDPGPGFGTPAGVEARANLALSLTEPGTVERLAQGLHMLRGPYATTIEDVRLPEGKVRELLPEDYGVTSYLVSVVRSARDGRPVERKNAVLVVSDGPEVGGGAMMAFGAVPVFGREPPNADLAALNAGLAQPWIDGPAFSAERAAKELRASGRPEAHGPSTHASATATLWVTRDDLDGLRGARVPSTRRDRDLALVAGAVVQPVYAGTEPTGRVRAGVDGVEELAAGFGNASRTRGLVLDARRVEALALAGGPRAEEAVLRLAGTNLARSHQRLAERAATQARGASREGGPGHGR